MRIGSRGVPKPISTSGQTQMNSTFGSRRATNLSCTISPLYRQGSKPMHLLMTIFGFGNTVKTILPSHAQFLAAFRQTQIGGPDTGRTSRVARATRQDRRSPSGERRTPNRRFDFKLQPGPSRKPHFRRQSEQAIRLNIFDTPEVERIARQQPVRISPPTTHSRAAKQQIQQASHSPQPIPVIPARFPS